MADEKNTPAKIIGKHFPVTITKEKALELLASQLPEVFTVEFGINPEKGGLTAYGYTDGLTLNEGTRHNLGRFPVTGYSSQWKMRTALQAAALGFIAWDEKQTTPRLATKAQRGTGSVEMEEGIDLDDMLTAD